MARTSITLDPGDNDSVDIDGTNSELNFGNDGGQDLDDGDGSEDSYGDEYLPDLDGNLDDEEMAGELEGYDDLFAGDDAPPQDEDYLEGSSAKRARPAFFERTTKRAERGALRSTYTEGDALILTEAGGNLMSTGSSRIPGTFGRQNREKGSTLPAYHRKVTAELDDDDELMMEMREKGYTDRQIADKLAADGRVRYEPKSVATRIVRIKEVQAEHVDYLLKEGYKEWELEDDQLLMHAFDLADIEIRYEMERLRARRFNKVSEYMRRLDKEAVFSKDACRDRYTSIINGTAVIPIEQSDDPDARRMEAEAFREEREAIRLAEQAEKDKKETYKERIKREALARGALKQAAIAERRNKEAQEKADRAVKRAAQASIKAQQAAENDKKKAERNALIQAKKQQEEIKKRQHARRHFLRIAAVEDKDDDSPDPRADLDIDDLRRLCVERKISTHLTRNKEEILQRLRDKDQELNQAQLKALIKKKGLSLGGTKAQMRYQLAVAACIDCTSYKGPGSELRNGGGAGTRDDDGEDEDEDEEMEDDAMDDVGDDILSDHGFEV